MIMVSYHKVLNSNISSREWNHHLLNEKIQTIVFWSTNILSTIPQRDKGAKKKRNIHSLFVVGKYINWKIKTSKSVDITVIEVISKQSKNVLHFLNESDFLAASHVSGEVQDCLPYKTASR